MPVGFIVSGRDLEVLLTGQFTPREAEAAITVGLGCSRSAPVRLLIEIRNPSFLATPSNIQFRPDMPESLRARIATRCAFVGPDDAQFFEAANGVMRHIAPLGLEIGTFRDVDSAKAWLDQTIPAADDS
jgi:hypothetical protein